MTEQAKSQTNKAILLPIIGLLVAGVVGTIAVPEISRATADRDKLFAFTTSMFFIALIFGASIAWAQKSLAQLSLVSQVPSIRKSHAFVVTMQWVWLSINSIVFLSFLIAFNAAVSSSGMSYYNEIDYNVISTVNVWTAIPLSMLGILLLVQALVFLEYSSRTVVPAAPTWQPPVYTPPAV